MSTNSVSYTEYTCDRCSTMTRNYNGFGRIHSFQDRSGAPVMPLVGYSFDLCETCVKEFKQWWSKAGNG